jgi:hypothetical protein
MWADHRCPPHDWRWAAVLEVASKRDRSRDAHEQVPAHDERVRVLTIQTVAMGVSAEEEANWPRLAAAATLAAEEGREPVPAVWFRTDEGASGLIPVSELTPVTFTDDEEPVRFIGTVTALGPDAAPST